jgi:hypothetical protein
VETGQFATLPCLRGTNITIPNGTEPDDMDYFGTLSDMETDILYGNQTGDICRYLGKINPGLAGYRMPTANELLSGNWREQGTSQTITTTSPDGQTPIDHGGSYGGYVFFSASGYRMDTGELRPIGSHGYRWSGSPVSGDREATFTAFFVNGTVKKNTADNTRGLGFPIRCIKDE